MESSCVYGMGVVGQATAEAFGINNYYSRNKSNTTLKQAGQLRYHFICLPTPTVNNRCFTDDILALIKALQDFQVGQNVYIIRSTVLPGFCRYITQETGAVGVVHNPEFLSEDTWVKDTMHPDLVVIGGDQRNFVEDVAGIYKSRYKYIEPIMTDSITSEMIKYAVNTFFATKVMFGNQIYDICKRLGVNYETVKKAMYQQKFIGANHLDIWHKGGRGAGGKCLRKDLDAFTEYANSKLLTLIKKLNDEYLDKFPKGTNLDNHSGV